MANSQHCLVSGAGVRGAKNEFHCVQRVTRRRRSLHPFAFHGRRTPANRTAPCATGQTRTPAPSQWLARNVRTNIADMAPLSLILDPVAGVGNGTKWSQGTRARRAQPAGARSSRTRAPALAATQERQPCIRGVTRSLRRGGARWEHTSKGAGPGPGRPRLGRTAAAPPLRGLHPPTAAAFGPNRARAGRPRRASPGPARPRLAVEPAPPPRWAGPPRGSLRRRLADDSGTVLCCFI